MDQYEALRKALDFIEVNIRTADMEQIASAAGVSEGKLNALFEKHRGIPTGQYLLMRRLAHAAFDAAETGRELIQTAPEYGFRPDSFLELTVRQFTGYSLADFSALRPTAPRMQLGAGLFGAGLPGGAPIKGDFSERTRGGRSGSMLYGLPKVSYGTYGGVTPYPICLKACAGYMGSNADYAAAMVGSGAACRLTWNREKWDGGNVDVIYTFDGEARKTAVYENGAKALGLEYRILPRTEERTKEDVKAFLRAALDEGMPVIAMGVIGPPEACIVAGYKGDGDVLLGWNLFQEARQPGCDVWFDDCGYFTTDTWYENGVDTLIAIGKKTGAGVSAQTAAKRAVEVMTPRMDGPHAKGLLAWDAWRESLEQDDFPCEFTKLGDPLMCVCDAIDCITDGRYNASRFFRSYRNRNPLYKEAAEHFETVYKLGMEMYKALGGWERGEKQLSALREKKTREKLCALICEAKAHDEAAMNCLLQL